jgi:RNA polymerase sigma-70 factor (ECF subfamily)
VPPAPQPAPPPLLQPQRADADAALVRQHHTALWRYLRVLGAAPEEADDLAQEAFVVLLRTPFADRGPAALRTWLRTTARQLFFAHCRRVRRTPVALDETAVERALADYEQDDDGRGYRASLERCLATLPHDHRRLLEASVAGAARLPALAAERGVHPEALRSLLRRLKLELRDCVRRRLHPEDRR